jgi:tetratricopeptide (TPR) repeat protein
VGGMVWSSVSGGRRAGLLAWGIAFLGATTVIADPGSIAPSGASVPSDEASDAQGHFDEGLRLAQRGDYEGAARELARAYAVSPSPPVLFNLGQAYSASGRPVEAYDALAEYLRLSEGKLDAERERLVRQLMDNEAARIAEVWLDVEPAGATIEVDGQALGAAPLRTSIRLKAGLHALVARHDGYRTEVVNLDLQPGERALRSIRLAAPPAASAPGYLLVSCSVPDLELREGNVVLGQTPLLRPLALPSGQHELELQRPGYLTQRVVVRIEAARDHALTCEGRIDPALASELGATLVLDESLRRQGARLEVDGHGASHTSRLPSGKHWVDIRVPGYERWYHELTLGPRTTVRLAPLLVPEPRLHEALERRQQQRLWSGVALGGGVLLGGAALTLAIVNSNKHERWLAERDELSSSTIPADELELRLRASYDEALDIQRLEHLTVASVLVSAACVGVSAFLWFTSDRALAPRDNRSEARRWGTLRYDF